MIAMIEAHADAGTSEVCGGLHRIEFHSAEDLRQMQGVGTLLKEQRLIDHRPKSAVDSKSLSPNPGEAVNLPHTS